MRKLSKAEMKNIIGGVDLSGKNDGFQSCDCPCKDGKIHTGTTCEKACADFKGTDGIGRCS